MDELTLIIRDNGISHPRPPLRVNLTRLSLQTGYHLSYLSRVFSGKANPTMKCMNKITEALGVDMNVLKEIIGNGKSR
jgi:predicted transcriptional regulator